MSEAKRADVEKTMAESVERAKQLGWTSVMVLGVHPGGVSVGCTDDLTGAAKALAELLYAMDPETRVAQSTIELDVPKVQP